jgi:hypothetical protein
LDLCYSSGFVRVVSVAVRLARAPLWERPGGGGAPADAHQGRPPRRRHTCRTRLVALALDVTLLTLATLIGLKVSAERDGRADTASSVRLCLQQQARPDTAHRLLTLRPGAAATGVWWRRADRTR